MGELINLSERRARRASCPTGAAVAALPTGLYYDLGCPFSYLAAERFERLLGEAAWYPAPPRDRAAGTRPGTSRDARREAERAAAALRLPLTWPERFGADCTGLHRAAVCAAELGGGARFALAALRLGFCGGFDLSDPAIIVEAAAAAGLPIDPCLEAAADSGRDGALDDVDAMLRNAGVTGRPAIHVGERFFAGHHAVVQAAALRTEWQRLSNRPAS